MIYNLRSTLHKIVKTGIIVPFSKLRKLKLREVRKKFIWSHRISKGGQTIYYHEKLRNAFVHVLGCGQVRFRVTEAM